MAERTRGYYCVKDGTVWTIAYWDGNDWGLAFDEDPYTDQDLAEIGPRIHDYDGQPPSHDGDCTYYASKSNGHPTDGICTCGFGARRSRQGDDSQIITRWRREATGTQESLGKTIGDRLTEFADGLASRDVKETEKNNPAVCGWGWPRECRKAHYFVNGRSLCGAWGFTGEVSDDHTESADDCKRCTTRRNRREKP